MSCIIKEKFMPGWYNESLPFILLSYDQQKHKIKCFDSEFFQKLMNKHGVTQNFHFI